MSNPYQSPSAPLGTAAAGASPGRLAWIIVALLAPVALLNYLDRQMLAAMKSSVMGDLTDIGDEANWGRMLGQFKWVYAFLSPIGGWIADRFGRRYTICGSLFAWSAVTWWTGHVQNYEELLWARSLMGISEAFYIPAALALIADHHSTATRSRAVGLHQMGIYLGVIAGGFAGFVSQHPALGWRSAFTACGVVGMVYTVPLMMLLKRTGRPSSESPSMNGLTMKGSTSTTPVSSNGVRAGCDGRRSRSAASAAATTATRSGGNPTRMTLMTTGSRVSPSSPRNTGPTLPAPI